MTRDTDIARIAAMLYDVEANYRGKGFDNAAAALYEAGLRPSVEPAGLGGAAEAYWWAAHDWIGGWINAGQWMAAQAAFRTAAGLPKFTKENEREHRDALHALSSGGSPATPGPTGATANETPPDGLPTPAASPRQGEPVGLDVAWRGDGPCKDCGTLDNIVWFTDNVLWNRVTGETVYAEESRGAILCIPCFVTRADRAGLNPTAWRLLPEWPWREAAALSDPAEAGEPG